MQATTAATVHTEKNLRKIFAAMAPHKAQAIRDAYYEAVCGLQELAEQLELADLDVTGDDHVLIHEHAIALEAVEAMKSSLLGKVL